MSEEQHGKSNGVSEFTRTVSTWFGFIGAGISVIAIAFSSGIFFGPVKEAPEKITVLSNQFVEIKGRADKIDWAIDSLKSRADALASQQVITSDDRSKSWDALRKIEATAVQLKANSISREDMIEWTAALGSRNRTLSVPPISRQHE